MESKEQSSERVFQCDSCRGLGFTYKNKKKVMCSCVLKKKVVSYLSGLGKYDIDKYFNIDISLFRDNNLCIIGDEESISKIKGYFAVTLFNLFNINKPLSYKILYSYDLMDMFTADFGDPNVKTLNSLHEDIVIVLCGFNEYSSDKLVKLMTFFLTKRTVSDKKVWFYIKEDSVADFKVSIKSMNDLGVKFLKCNKDGFSIAELGSDLNIRKNRKNKTDLK